VQQGRHRHANIGSVHAGYRFAIIPLLLIAAGLPAVPSAGARPSASTAKSCSRFIVGKANTTRYRRFRLPARGTVSRASCVTLRRIARRMHTGKYKVPAKAIVPAPRWGRPVRVRDGRRRWSCRLQSRGDSGPKYAVRCSSRGGHRLRWRTG
jgi:hypothetical protein